MDKYNLDIEPNALHWAFTGVKKTIQEHGMQDEFVCASGVTPSGTIHIGNFREIITVDLVRRAFKKSGYKVKHIHSWDNYDVFRKVPKNMPKQDILQNHLRMSIVDTPDTNGKYSSYAEAHLKEVEETLPLVGINPEYKYQADLYKKCIYAEQMKKALDSLDTIKSILNEFRKEPLESEWLPVSVFCDVCKKDTITKLDWKGSYNLYYECECGHKEEFDFRKKGIAKLVWRVDWPMRWNYERVNFEPGGKDHSSDGGSYDTAKTIVRKVWGREPPSYIMYDFISIKGGAGKISSSSGDVITLKDCLTVYSPEIVRYLFAGTRPNTEFAISFDMDVIKIYEDYDKCERIYYGKEEVTDKEKEKNSLIYEFSQITDNPAEIPKEIPIQIPFRKLVNLLNMKNLDVNKVMSEVEKDIKTESDRKKIMNRIVCARNWLSDHADENFKFTVNEIRRSEFLDSLKDNEKTAISMLKQVIQTESDPEKLNTAIFDIPKKCGLEMKDFFKLAYQAIISKDRGPKLASFILEIGKDRVVSLL